MRVTEKNKFYNTHSFNALNNISRKLKYNKIQ